MTSQASPVWRRPLCLGRRSGEAGDSFCCCSWQTGFIFWGWMRCRTGYQTPCTFWGLSEVPSVLWSSPRLPASTRSAINDLLLLGDQGTGILWQPNWRQRVIQIMAIAGMALIGALAVHIAMMLLPARRLVLDAEGREFSTHDLPGAMDKCPAF